MGPGYRVRLWSTDAVSALLSPLQRTAHTGIRILVYHDIVDARPSDDPFRLSVSPSQFEEQIRQLHASGAQCLSLADAVDRLRAGAVPHHAVVLTFDDGYASFVTHALPILARYRAPATVFVSVGHVGSERFAFNREGPFTRPLTWDEIAHAASTDGIDIGSHTMTHRPLHTLARDEQRDELSRSRERLEARLGRPVRTFAYPFGAWGTFPKDLQRTVADAGYTAACANVMGAATAGADLFALPRTRIDWADGPRRFAMKLRGAYDWTDALRRRLD